MCCGLIKFVWVVALIQVGVVMVCATAGVMGIPSKFYTIHVHDNVAHGANATLVQSTLNRLPEWAECVPQGEEENSLLRIWCPHAPHSAVTKDALDEMEPGVANACLSLDHCQDAIFLQWTDGVSSSSSSSSSASSKEGPVRPGLLDPTVFNAAWSEGLETTDGAWEEVYSKASRWESALKNANPSDVWVVWGTVSDKMEGRRSLSLEPQLMETKEVWQEVESGGSAEWTYLQRYSLDPLLTLGYKTSIEVAVLVTKERGDQQDSARGLWVLGDAVIHFGKQRYVATRLTARESHFPGSVFHPPTRHRTGSPFVDDAWGLDRFQLHLKDQDLPPWAEIEAPIFDAAASAVLASLKNGAAFRLPEEGGGDFDVVFVMMDLSPLLEPRVVSARIATHSLIEASTRTMTRFHTHNVVSLWNVVLLDSRSRVLDPDPVLADIWLSPCDSRMSRKSRACETIVGAWRLWVSTGRVHRVHHEGL